MKKYLSKKVLNNNIVQAIDSETNEECILLGKGIGFSLKMNEWINPSKIEKKFYIKDHENLDKYKKLVAHCDEELILIVEEFIGQIEDHFNCPFSENLHIGLLDHLNFSLYRIRNNLTVSNIFIDEISIMYAKEYAFSKKMLKEINKRLGVELPDVEIGFIALHIHSSIKGEAPSRTALFAKIISHCLSEIEDHFAVTLDPMNLNRARLVTHLKFALKRASENKSVANALVDSLKTAYKDTFQFANHLAHQIQVDYGIVLPEGEIGYLTIHIENVIAQEKKEENHD